MDTSGAGESPVTRLRLSRPEAGDLDELHALHADPRVWEHCPSGRHPAVRRLVLADRALDEETLALFTC